MSIANATYLAAIVTFVAAALISGRPSKPTYADLEQELQEAQTELMMKQAEELGTLRGMNYR